jgi:hypothetical protein
MGSKPPKASWVLLTIVGGLTLFISLVSAFLAYVGEYPIGGMPVEQVAGGREGLHRVARDSRDVGGFRRRLRGGFWGRCTSRRETGAWWTILLATLAMALIVLARIPHPGCRSGQGGTPRPQCSAAHALGLLDVGRLSRP